MSTLLLVRHGRTPANAAGILAGRTTGVHLDEVGEKSAHELRERMCKVPVVHVVSSPLERTVQTANIVFEHVAHITHEEGLLECDYGNWQGKSLADLGQDPLWKTVQEDPESMIFPQGESMLQMANRAVGAIRKWDKQLVAQHGQDVIWAAVSHGDVIKAICADALGLPLNNFQRIVIDPTSVSVIHYQESGSAIRKLNDTGDSWVSQLIQPFDGPTLGGQNGREATV